MTRRPDSPSGSSGTSQEKLRPADARVTIRLAAPADAAGIVACNLASWREAYSGLLSPEFLARQDAAERAALWTAALADDRNRVAVATMSAAVGAPPDARGRPDPHPSDSDSPAGTVVGFAACKVSGAGPEAPERELASMYVRRAFHGSGIADRLFDVAVGDGPCVLWVAERNPRAIAFYRKHGFRLDGRRSTLPDWEDLPIVCMVR